MEKYVGVSHRYEVSLEIGAGQWNVPRRRLVVKRAPTTPKPSAPSGTETPRKGLERHGERLRRTKNSRDNIAIGKGFFITNYKFVMGAKKEVATWLSVFVTGTPTNGSGQPAVTKNAFLVAGAH